MKSNRKTSVLLVSWLIFPFMQSIASRANDEIYSRSQWKEMDNGSFYAGENRSEEIFIDKYYRNNFNNHSYYLYMFYFKLNDEKHIISFENKNGPYDDFLIKSGFECLSNEFILNVTNAFPKLIRIKNSLGESNTTIDMLELEYNDQSIPGQTRLSFGLKSSRKIPKICKIEEILK
ncbi:hypothetical protein [Microvirga alba]|uniref:Uncharacterized protein n=1 Tax=Microvirga alba TaxID=2791025 RepID=A0A931BJF4_9HYPH|nr:hypothetical protein [Microvirga alba]MBF9232321.1 hypothetical protein [Microvirga alba]